MYCEGEVCAKARGKRQHDAFMKCREREREVGRHEPGQVDRGQIIKGLSSPVEEGWTSA